MRSKSFWLGDRPCLEGQGWRLRDMDKDEGKWRARCAAMLRALLDMPCCRVAFPNKGMEAGTSRRWMRAAASAVLRPSSANCCSRERKEVRLPVNPILVPAFRRAGTAPLFLARYKNGVTIIMHRVNNLFFK